MNHTMTLNKISENFTSTASAQAYAAAIESRVHGAREAGLTHSSEVSSLAPRMQGRAA